MTTIAAANGLVSYSTCGEGPGLVLVHGTSIDAQSNFGHVVGQFADKRRVVSPNYGGCGDSTVPEGELTLDVLVEQIAAVIRHACDGPVDLVGDSLGAVVAAATAARHPGSVRKLVLVAGWAFSGDARHQMVFETWARLQALDPELANRYVMSLAVNPPFLTALGLSAISTFLKEPAAPHTQQRIELGRQIDIRPLLKHIAAATLVIHGIHDHLVPRYQARALRESIRGAEYAEIDSGHAAFLEKADELVDLLRGFLFDSLPK